MKKFRSIIVLIMGLMALATTQAWPQTSQILSGDKPLEFTSIGTGTYDRSVLYHSLTYGYLIDLAKTTNSTSGTPINFSIDGRGGGHTFFRINGSNGNTGIGTFSPSAKLHVVKDGANGSGGIGDLGIVSVANTGQATIGAEKIGDGYANLNLGTNESGTRRFWHISKRAASTAHALQFFYYDGASFGNPKITFATDGNVGIGTSTPDLGLTLYDDAGVTNGFHGIAKFFRLASGTGNAGMQIGYEADGTSVKRSTLYFPGGSDVSFQVYDNGAKDVMHLTTNGDVGIGTTSPDDKLDVEGDLRVTNGHLRIYTPSGTAGFINGLGNAKLSIGSENGNELFVDRGLQRVGIGTSSPDSKLTVSGDIHAEEVKVDLTVPGPDYVFEENYELMSLEEIKDFIAQNKHLPEVPSVAVFEKEGIKLSEMNMLLLKKIEELTLHVIGLKTEIDNLKSDKNEN